MADAIVTAVDGRALVQVSGSELLAPLIDQVAGVVTETGNNAASAMSAAQTAQLAAATSVSASRYFPTRAAGEAASAVNQSFSTDDGAGSIVSYRRTSGGSVEISRSITPVTLGGYAKLTGGVGFATSGSRVGITDDVNPITPQALLNVVNQGSTTNTLRITSYWPGTGSFPYTNNDTILVETFNKCPDDAANRSWSISAVNYGGDVPAGKYMSGELVGTYGWSVTVDQAGYRQFGRIASQVGARGRAGFQGTGTPASALIDLSVGVQGEIVADSTGSTITSGRAGNFISTISVGTVLNNHGVYSEASGGAATNWSFFGAAGQVYNRDQAFFGNGSLSAAQSNAAVTVRGMKSNGVEFGSGDTAGYGSNLGATAASGSPFLAFCAEADATGNTYRTRGKAGSIIRSDLAGAVLFSRVTNVNAGNQAPADDVIWRPDGKFLFTKNQRWFGTPPATATSPGEQWEVSRDADFLYVCVADNVWKRTPLATW